MAVERLCAEAAVPWELSPSGRRRRRWAVEEAADGGDPDPDPAVLRLSHFSRPPFLSFGTVRVGTSRTRRLVLENPNAEPVFVALCRPPPAAKGFAVEPFSRLLQPRERVFVSIAWTPLEDGGVRELVTFVVNDVVKHQAVLLGNAEQPVRKKRSLWEAIKKRPVAQQPQYKKGQSRIKNVNKTFQISPQMSRVRSPLQHCENLENSRYSSSPKQDSPVVLENRVSLSPISPILQENKNVTCTPLLMRRSTTYSVLDTVEYNELPKSKKETFTVLPIGDDYLLKTELENDCIVRSVEAENSNTNSAVTPEQLRRVHTTSDDKRTLSLDSLPALESSVSILSPDQFLKENQIAIEPASQVCKPVLPSDTESCMSKSSPQKQQKKTLQVVTFSVEHQFQNKAFNTTSEGGLTVFHNEKCEQNLSFPAHTVKHHMCRFQKQEPPIRPLLSSTVIKCKQGSLERKEPHFQKPKSKKCLSKAIQQCVDKVGGSTKVERLPVIESLADGDNCRKGEKASTCSESASCNRKRKSGEYLEEIKSGREEYMDTLDTKKLAMSCELKDKHADTKTSVPKSANREKQSQKKRVGFLSQKSRTTRRTSKNIHPVAQSQLTFVKPLKTVLPRHPMPFVAKNMFYDERWKEKQQRGFTWWLNFVLTPDDFTVKTDISHVNAASLILGTESCHKSSVSKAPTKEEVSLRAYSARCKLNKLRRSACHLFTCSAMVKAIKRLEVEIETKHLLVRKDQHLWKDIGQRQKILNWLLCYNPLWLRIGLETVYGELIALENNSDVTGLAMFILSRLLWNPDIAAEYRHPTVPHLYRDGHEEALSKFTLKKLLLLVCFLDRAKSSRIIDHDPCLFCKNAEFKSSREILLAFSRDFLSGEGDLSRHLGFLGLPVNHAQTPLDEFDFAVVNLATDLQCGIRLVRTLELLSKNWSLSKKLRVPAISRLQKMHNVNVALQVLKDHGIQLKDEYGSGIDAKDIVDRHREKTLALLWKIVFAFQVNVFLDLHQLKTETDFLKSTHDTQVKMSALESSITLKVRKDSSSFYSSETCSENVKLLMDWVNAVCAFYGIQVENFTVSFSDGRVLCYLIHHYHPCYMPLEAISQHTTQTVECTNSGTLTQNFSSESDDSLTLLNGTFGQAVTTSALYKELLDNERKNFQLINTAVSDLGGVPAMIHHVDMSNTIPDEKVVITYVSFLCSRLLDLCKEIRAARCIQSAWREHRLKKKLAQNIKQTLNATIIIQKHWKRYLAQRELQKLKTTKQEEAERVSSIVIQKYWRRYCARRKYQQLQYNTILMQARIRMLHSHSAYKKVLSAALTIQRHWRASLRAKNDYRSYQKLKSSAFVIQSAFRRWKGYKMKQKMDAEMMLQELELAKKARAAVVIQSWYRMIRIRNSYLYVRQSVIKIQACFRCILAKFIYQQERATILTIQKYYRAYRLGKTEREMYLQKREAVVVLQSAFRGMKARLLVQQMKAACIIQSFWRMRQERLRFLHVKHSVIVVQSYVRKQQQLKRYQAIKDAASAIQARYRAYIACKKAVSAYQKLRCAAVILQSAFRARQARMKVNVLKSVIKIQSSFRAYIVRKRFLNLKLAAVKIQAFVKMRQARRYYCTLREAAIYVQRRYRSQKHAFQLKEEYAKLRRACVIVQAVVRGNHTRKWVKRRQEAAIVLQAQYRMKRERQHYLSLCRASAVIQLHYRAYRERTCQRQIFLQIKKATICLQAACRGYILRKTLQLENEAARKIQAAFRAHAARKKYQAMVQASLMIQRRYRAYKATSQIRKSFLRTKAAIITLQAASRGWLVRKQIQKQHAAVTVIQSAFRKYIALKKFTMMRNAALTLQRHYRAIISGREQRQAYVLLRTCIIQLQAAWRGSVVRAHIKRQHQSAVIIQSYYKMHVIRAKFKSLRQAAILVQRRYCAVVLANCQRQEYLALKEAAVKIQAVYRGMRTRRKVQHMHRAAVCIQTVFKMHQVYSRYQTLKLATSIIQVRYRALCRRRQEQTKYLELKKASLILQSAYRGMKIRQEQKTLHQSAVCIQSFYRMYKQRKSFQQLVAATKVIQQWYRGCKDRNVQVQKYRQIKIATLQIQSKFRGMKERHHLKKMHVAATTIQRRFRAFRQRQSFISVKAATVTIQRKYRGTVLAKQKRGEYLCVRKAAIIVQSTFRGMLARERVKKMHAAATTIQASSRMRIARNHYRAMKLASVVIQQHYRAYRKAKNTRELYLRQRHSALIFQAAYRGMKMRRALKKWHIAAAIIQSHFRMHRQRCSFRKLQWAAIIIQKRFRTNQLSTMAMHLYSSAERTAASVPMASYNMKARLQGRHHAAVVLQRSFKMWRHRRKYLAYQAAAVILQRRYRALILSRRQAQEYLCLRTAVICIQSFYRGFKVRRKVRRMHSAARVIQAEFRVHQERLSYQRLQHAAATIQNYYRAYLKGKHQRKVYLVIWKAAVVIQASYRGMRGRQELHHMHVSASVIQSFYRMRVQRKRYKQLCWAAITIQSAYRGMVACRKAKEIHTVRNVQPCFHMAVDDKMTQYRTAAITLQALYRANKARVQYQKYRKAAIVIQRYFRSFLAMQHQRRVYVQTLRSIIVVQATVRGFLERRRVCRIKSAAKMQILEQNQQSSLLRFIAFAYHHLAAVKIQKAFRIHLLRKQEQMQLASVLYIQRWYRAKVQRREFLQYLEKIVKIQRMVRKWMKYKNASSGKVQKGMSQKTLNNGITKFQALWRGYSWRKKTDTDETRALRDSLVMANKESKEEMKLCNRTAFAIDRLLKYRHFSYILAALKDLEVVTRLSPVCCENMAQTEAVPTIFTLIRSCNRSVPSMDVIRYSVQILLNLSKYEKTTQAVYAVENSVDTLLELLQMYRERPGDKVSERAGNIFTKTCCLLALLSKDSASAFEIRRNPRVIARLQSLFKLTSRKHQMDAQRVLAKQKTSAFRNGHCSVPVTPVRTKVVSRQRPDWVLRKDNMQEIVDPLQAIQMVMDTFGISCY
ncbi:abnormal spindle-like microcephaly-associated protein [Eublepharis macularius]|uniref:Abnormal spindle-like microcephaly-associated protein n=1 Tax=Eublepharis macularius TaxID=481883 RepID=A0AA97L073_EUBMA|nr:abnormal spindle-like microcephaly-associated protein [Eublepharis macularius]